MSKFIDVTVPLSAELPTFPGDPAFQLDATHQVGSGDSYNVCRLALGTHTGTHVDAPFHFIEGGARVDELALEILIGRARVVDLQGRDSVERADLEALDLRDDLRLLLKTRNSGLLRHSTFQEDYVYLSPNAATYLAQVGIKLVGFDYLSIEKFGSTDYAAHVALLKAGVVIVEGLDLSEIEPGEYDMVCLPLRIAGADGSPARVVLRPR
jgi:arylformamidase